MVYAIGDGRPLPERHDSLVKVMDEDGEVLYVRPQVLVEWGTEGHWTALVRGQLEWGDLLVAELVALRYAVEQRESVLGELRELRKGLETGVDAFE